MSSEQQLHFSSYHCITHSIYCFSVGRFFTYDIKRIKLMLSFHVQIDLGFAIIIHSILYCLWQITRYISLSVILTIV